MNVTLPKKEKVSITTITIYVVSILACIIAALIIGHEQHFESDKSDKKIGTVSARDFRFRDGYTNFKN